MQGLVIIPTYNEKDNIGNLVARVLQADARLTVLVVDDNSPDGTGRLVDELAASTDRLKVIHRAQKFGLASAYLAGFRYALAHGFDLVFEMDGDLSHDPRYLPDFIARMEVSDLVVGSRYLTGVNVINWPLHRLLLSYFANRYARLITGAPLTDLTSGYKCFRRQALERLDLDRVDSEGYSFQIEMTCLCWRQGLRVSEIPIVFTDRSAGVTKMSKNIIFEAVLVVWKLRLKRF